MRERAYFIRKLPLHVYTCRFLLPLRWLSVPPGTLPCFLFQKLQPLRKSPSIGQSGWRIAFGNSFSPIMEASVFGCSGCVCGSSFSLVLLCLLEMMLLLGRVCFDCCNGFIASPWWSSRFTQVTMDLHQSGMACSPKWWTENINLSWWKRICFRLCQFVHLGVRYGDKCLDIGLLKHWGTNLCGVCIPQEGAAEGFFFGLKHFQV